MQLFSRIVMGRADRAQTVQRDPDRVQQDAGGDGDAEAPAGLQPYIQIGERQHAAEQGAHDDGPPRELAHAVAAPAIDLLVPLALDLVGRAAEALDG
jgi:hypothetical protein